ncbi:hypothetical protein ACTA71_011732 [Dictyostelium dimigraforme]
MGRLFKTYLTGPSIICCLNCKTHLTLHDQLISKQFQGRHGTAFLFGTCSNITVGPSEDRTLTTGMHIVADIYCIDCGETLGWKYEFAKEESQKYKVGKYILEKAKIQKEVNFGTQHQQHSLVALENISLNSSGNTPIKERKTLFTATGTIVSTTETVSIDNNK